MKAVFVHDTFYSRGPGGEIYAFGNFPASLWTEKFLTNFTTLTIIGRERAYEPSHITKAIRSDAPGVGFVLLPNINKPLARILSAAPIIKTITEEVGQADALIIRGPSEFGMIAAKAARSRDSRSQKLTGVNLTKVNTPYAVEMSGCAFDHTWHHGSLTGRLYAPVKYLRARHMVKNADAVTYVTKSFLQKRYPPTGTLANASNVEIDTPSSDVLSKRVSRIENQQKIIFGMIGNYGNKLKGLQTALAALARIEKQLPTFEFHILGHGNPALYKQPWLRFDGPFSEKSDVLNWLDGIDIYLQPSLHEGLPRGLIEAMSRACPALASTAGGINELLDAEATHRRGDDKKLSVQIINALNPDWQKRQAKLNFKTSKSYAREILMPRREQFWAEFTALARARQTQNLLVSRNINTFSLKSEPA